MNKWIDSGNFDKVWELRLKKMYVLCRSFGRNKLYIRTLPSYVNFL